MQAFKRYKIFKMNLKIKNKKFKKKQNFQLKEAN